MREELGFWRKYVFSTDHKVIAKQYLSLGLFWALVIGAKDMAFPRLNMLSFWVFALASLILLASFFVPGGAAAAGRTGYPPLSAKMEYTGVGLGMDLWLLSLALEFASFLMGGVNFLTTAMNLRAPGMTFFRLPIVVWMQLTAAVIFMLSVGPLIAGAVMLLLDRIIGTTFYLPAGGGEPLLWQHLFWFFGHPEVYVILLPGLGIVVDVITVFSRKPVFAYRPIIYSTIIAGFLSFIVWAHTSLSAGWTRGSPCPSASRPSSSRSLSRS